MRLTKKGRFAVTAMIDLALELETRQDSPIIPITLASISQRQHISLSYLQQIFCKLRRQNLVKSVYGPGGGYLLARAADKITVADIIAGAEEAIDTTECGSKGQCDGLKLRDHQCATHHLWSELNEKIAHFLQSITLQDLLKKHNKRLLLSDIPKNINQKNVKQPVNTLFNEIRSLKQ